MVKENIPKTIKNSVWLKYMGKIFEGKCFCCGLTNISVFDYVCGHVESENKGGKVCVSNLRPICVSCNGSMSTMNMYDFMNKYGYSTKESNKHLNIINNSDEDDECVDECESSDDSQSSENNDNYNIFTKDQLEIVCNALSLDYPNNKKSIINILKNNFISTKNIKQIQNKFDTLKRLGKDELRIECVKKGLINSGLLKSALIKELLCFEIGLHSSVDKKKTKKVENNFNIFMKDDLSFLSCMLDFTCKNNKSKLIELFENNFYTATRLSKVRETHNIIKNYNKNKLIEKCKKDKLLNSGLKEYELIAEILRHTI